MPLIATAGLTTAYQITDKQERQVAVGDDESGRSGKHSRRVTSAKYSAEDVKGALSQARKENRSWSHYRRRTAHRWSRPRNTVRPIEVQVGVLPRAHGSAIFTRGETQAIVVTTLGTGRDAQIIDAIEGERKEQFMLHYNFPPYCCR